MDQNERDLMDKLADLERRLQIQERNENQIWKGTSFPTTGLYDKRKFTRSDRNIEYYYDLANTRWLSDLRVVTLPSRSAQPYSGSTFWDTPFLDYALGNGIYFEKILGIWYTNAPCTVANYYTIQFFKGSTSGNSQTALTGSFDTSTFTTAALFYEVPITFNQTLSTSMNYGFIRALQVGSAITFQAWWQISYRLIG